MVGQVHSDPHMESRGMCRCDCAECRDPNTKRCRCRECDCPNSQMIRENSMERRITDAPQDSPKPITGHLEILDHQCELPIPSSVQQTPYRVRYSCSVCTAVFELIEVGSAGRAWKCTSQGVEVWRRMAAR